MLFASMLERGLDLGGTGRTRDAGHELGELARINAPRARLAFGRTVSAPAEIADLDIKRADPSRGIEHVGLELAGHVPGPLARAGGIDDEQQAAAMTRPDLAEKVANTLTSPRRSQKSAKMVNLNSLRRRRWRGRGRCRRHNRFRSRKQDGEHDQRVSAAAKDVYAGQRGVGTSRRRGAAARAEVDEGRQQLIRVAGAD